MPPILDRSILDTTDEYPIVFNAVLQDTGRGPALRVGRVQLDDPDAVPRVYTPPNPTDTTFVLREPSIRPHELAVIATTRLEDGRLVAGFAVLGQVRGPAGPGTWPVTIGEIPAEAGGGVWCNVAVPDTVTLGWLDPAAKFMRGGAR